MKNPILPFLEGQGVVVLDGGLATELEARGFDLSDELWSALYLLRDPGAIRRVHLDYLLAGADCITTATYQATVEGFARRGLGPAEARRLMCRAVELAREARDAFWAEAENRQGRLFPLVAASAGPYGAFLADGSEYTGRYGPSEAELRRFHAERFALLAESGADLLACETIPSGPEARVLARLVGERPRVRAWLSFSCGDGRRLWDGTPIAELAAELEGVPGLVALGVNCTAPRLVGELLAELARATSKPLVVYPNAGEGWDAVRKCWLKGTEALDLAEASIAWHAAGARLLGGCCRVGPRDVTRIRERLLGSVERQPSPARPSS